MAKTSKKAARKKSSRRKPRTAGTRLIQGYGSEPGFPISLAMRAGDFIFTSAQGDHGFNPADVVYDRKGLVVSDGNTLPPRSMADETRATLRCIEASLKEAGCTLADVVYDKKGLVVSDGNTLPPRSMADETRATLRCIEASLKEAGCTLADVVDTSVWLRDPRDFAEMNRAYGEFFIENQPTRSIFRIDFMFDCRIEIKVTAYRPLTAAQRRSIARNSRTRG
jgi:2-iminobutanoate/2-iminopropanoate deaminase